MTQATFKKQVVKVLTENGFNSIKFHYVYEGVQHLCRGEYRKFTSSVMAFDNDGFVKFFMFYKLHSMQVVDFVSFDSLADAHDCALETLS